MKLILGERGVSLLETVVIIFIISLMSYIVYTFFGAYLEKSYSKGEYEQAHSLLVSSLEEEKVIYKSDDSYVEYENKEVSSEKVGNKIYKVIFTVKDITHEGNLNDIDGLIELVGRVEWERKNVEVVTYVSKK